VPLSVKEKWQKELEAYLRRRQQLAGLVLLSDIRHPLKDFDRMMIEWASQSELPLLLLLTKADKLKRGAASNTLLKVKKELQDYQDLTVTLFSSVDHQGLEAARKHLSGWLAAPQQAGTEQDDEAPPAQ
jgi:GTP-binding protein